MRVDCAVDAVGYEARGCGHDQHMNVPAQVLNDVMTITKAGGSIGIPGAYMPQDPGGVDEAAKQGSISLAFGPGWTKSLSFTTGQCPVMKYNAKLYNAIMHDKLHIADAVNVRVIDLEDAPKAYNDFNNGACCKYVIDPHGLVRKHLKCETHKF